MTLLLLGFSLAWMGLSVSAAYHVPSGSLNKLDQAVYLYPDNKVEEEMKVCKPFQVCNIVHNRRWYYPLVEKNCRCPNVNSSIYQHCPISVADDDDHTVHLNDRTMMKVCEDVREIGECDEMEVGLSEEIVGKNMEIKVTCRCNWPSYWLLNSHKLNSTYTFNSYRCTKLQQCEREGFCGYIRNDSFSLYYHCLCHYGSRCMSRDTSLTNVTEPLYSGSAMKAFCKIV